MSSRTSSERKRKQFGKSYMPRLEWVDRIFGEVKLIVDLPEVKHGLPEAVARFDFLVANYEVAVPCIDAQGSISLGFATKNHKGYPFPLALFPIFPGDREMKSAGMTRLFEQVEYGAYFDSIHSIFLATCGYQETHRFMAITALHEAGHAMRAVENRSAGKQPASYSAQKKLEEEVLMREFDCRLALLLGGEALRTTLEVSVRRILFRVASGGSFTHAKLEPGDPLDSCYGAVKSKSAIRNRSGLYSTYCYLTAIQEMLGPHSLQTKVDFLDWVTGGRYREREKNFYAQP